MIEKHWIPGFEGRYLAYGDGRIQSIGHIQKHWRNSKVLCGFGGSFRKPNVPRNGHAVVHLTNSSGRGAYSWQSMIALTFIGPRPAGYDIHHKDENPLNNRVENLEYVEQGAHRELHFEQRDNWSNTKLNDGTVRMIREIYERGLANRKELRTMFGVSRTTIWDVIHRKSWKNV